MKYISLIFVAIFVFACKKSKTTETNPEPAQVQTSSDKSFSRKEMLQNLADSVIAPALFHFSQEADSLYLLTSTFSATTNQQNLDALQNQLEQTALAWQYCSWFRYGTAQTQFGAVNGTKKMDNINTFPISTTKIESYISANDYSLNNTNYDTKGLGAMDYLLYSLDDKDSIILSLFNQNSSRIEYLKSLVLNIKTRANTVNTAWASEKNEFISDTGTDEYSTISSVVQDLDVDYENIKNNKVGIPVGRILLGHEIESLPDQTEAYFGGQSTKCIRANIEAIENVYLGRNTLGVNGTGFDDYLNASNDSVLAQNIQKEFATIYTKLNAIPEGRLSEIIKNNNVPVKELYAELEILSHYLETDLISALGLAISYDGGDGD